MERSVAIIGMAGKFPEAEDLGQFLTNLMEGRDSVRALSSRRMKATGLAEANYQLLGFMEGVDEFDHTFFNIPLGEAVYMDPHQRLILETVYHAIENAGYSTDALSGTKSSVYVGDTHQEYYKLAKEYNPTLLTGNLNATTAGRIARTFNLTGTALMVDTACSSSLVALHLACNDLILRDSDQAFVCGVSIILSPDTLESIDELGIDSKDGKARAFSADANGASSGEAVVCLILKRLEDAQRDGDLIHAVIRGSATNQDAARSSSLAAPSSIAQTEVIAEAWRKAGIEPEHITFIEAHGTGTPLGDPIEIEGITNAFAKFTNRKQFCALSAVKTNIGHTDSVAGIAGVLKAVLALKTKQLFPSLHFSAPNPYIDFINSPVYVNNKLSAWESDTPLRIAGVSSFGISGTNCHVVLQEREAKKPGDHQRSSCLITISAKTPGSLRRNMAALSNRISDEGCSLPDLAFTLATGRKHYPYRYAWAGNSRKQLAEDIEQALSLEAAREVQPPGNVWFFFDHAGDVSMEELALLAAEFPGFAKYFSLCLPWLTDRASQFHLSFVYQYCLYGFLSEAGIGSRKLAGASVGRIVMMAVKGDLQVAAALKQIDDGQFETFDRQKTDMFIQSKLSEKGCAVIKIGTNAELSDVFRAALEPSALCFTDATNLQSTWLFLKALYDNGFDLKWDLIYDKRKYTKVEAFHYSFEKSRCWVDTGSPDGVNSKVSRWFYRLRWIEEERGKIEPVTAKTFVYFSSAATLSGHIVDAIRRQGNHVIVVSAGAGFHKESQDVYFIDSFAEGDYIRLEQSILEHYKTLDGIVYENVSAVPEFTSATGTQVAENIFPLFRAFRSFYSHIQRPGFRLVQITRGAFSVFNEARDPFRHASASLLKALQSEQVMLRINWLDVAQDPDERGQAAVIWDEVCSDSSVRIASLRNGKRYVQRLERYFSPEISVGQRYREGGTYLITGGASGIGLEVARSIAELVNCNLILIGRRALSSTGMVDLLAPIRQAGSVVCYYAGDVGDPEFMTKTIREVYDQYGKIDGVIHAAGVSGERVPLDQLTTQKLNATLGAKIHGSLLLYDLTRHAPPGFFVFFSSLNTIVPQRFTADYTVANAFMDAFAEMLCAKGLNAVAINWGAWGETGAGERVDVTSEENKRSLLRAWTTADGISAFHLALCHRRGNIPVADMDDRLFMNTSFFCMGDHSYAGSTDLTGHPEWEILTMVERQVLVIWCEALKNSSLLCNDNFFQLGGHSLIGARIIQRIEKQLKTKITFRTLLENPTVKLLAAVVKTAGGNEKTVVPTQIRRLAESGSYALSHSQKRLWLLAQMPRQEMSYVIAKAFRFSGCIDVEAFTGAFNYLINRHEILRTVYQEVNGEPRQFVQPVQASFPNVFFEDLSHHPSPGEAFRTAFEQISAIPFDLEHGPLVKAGLYRLGNNTFGFVLCMHHIVTDDVSMKVLLSEIQLLYRSFRHQRMNLPGPLRIHYRDYAAWQNEQLSGDNLMTLQQYWQTKFSTPVTDLTVLYDQADPAGKAQTHHFVLDAGTCLQLRSVARKSEVSVFMLLLTVCKALLFRYTALEDLTVGIPVSGRDHPDLEGQLGFYVNTLAIRTRFSGTQSLAGLLSKVRQELLDAYQHQAYPYDMLVEGLRSHGTPGTGNLFNVFISYLTDEAPGTEKNGFEDFETTELQEVNYNKFDLEIEFYERSGTISVVMIYNGQCFSKEAVSDMAAHMEHIMADIEIHMELPLIDLTLGGEKEVPQQVFSTSETDLFDF